MSEETLTVYGELSASPWACDGGSEWALVSERGRHLYWELPGTSSASPEDFLLYFRGAFPNGGFYGRDSYNHAVVWSPIEDHFHGIGLRLLRNGTSQIVAIVECRESYPGSLMCPDRVLSLQALRFMAEEFLRGTDPMQIYECDAGLQSQNTAWWEYLLKLEKSSHWKYPEANSYLAKTAIGSLHRNELQWTSSRHQRPQIDSSSERVFSFSHRNDHDRRRLPEETYRREADDAVREPMKSHVGVERREETRIRDARSRSPMTNRMIHSQGKSYWDNGFNLANNGEVKQKHRCDRCNVAFDHSFELMRHYNTAQHQAALAKEFPI